MAEKLDENIEYIKQISEKASRIGSELIWSQVFHDTIRDSEWLVNKAFSPGRWAVGYPFLYVLYRVLNEFRPKNILELGLGQTTRMIAQYSQNYDIMNHIVVEHDNDWIENFRHSFTLSEKIEICNLSLEKSVFEKEEVLSYSDFDLKFNNKNFDFICIDAPFGGSTGGGNYARVDICNMLPEILSSSFAIMLDDVERQQDKNTAEKMIAKIKSSGIEICSKIYSGEKDLMLIVSKDLRFFCSM